MIKWNSVKGYDKDGNDITNLITVSGEVDTSKPGEYLLEYSVTDEQGETIKATRKVIVENAKNQDVVNQNVTTEEVQSSEKTENNEEVKIVGATFTRTYLSEPFDAKANITATDSNGKDITDLIAVEGEVDTNKLGSYELKYSVTDETGKTATLTRKVNVINKNIFNKYIEKVNEETKEKTKEVGFSIYLDNNTSKFLVENQSKDELDSTRKDEIIFKIRVIDKDNKEKLLVELLGSDTGDSEKLNSLKELEYSFGDYIEINTENAKDRFDIVGEMSGDIKSKENPETKEDESIKIEDYSDGVDNLDYLSNVRFKITEEGIETVYNEAPVIHGLVDINDVKDKSINPLDGITVTDDHDGIIDVSKISVNVEEKTDTYAVLRYSVEDSWGRCTSGTRRFSAIEKSNYSKVSFELKNSNDITHNVITVEGIPYYGDYKERFKIKFDPISKEIQIHDDDGRIMSNTEDEYFKFELYDKNMELKTSVTLLGTDKSDSEKLEAISNFLFEEGDYIGIWHAESESKLKIGGTVKGTTINENKEVTATEETKDYSNGVPQAEISHRRFRIKKSGLEEVKNSAPVIGDLPAITVSRGGEVELLNNITVTDDFDAFNTDSLESGEVSITHTPFDSSKVGDHTVTYTATDKWGNSSTKERSVTVTSDNPLDYTSIQFMKNENESLFKIKIDPVKNEFFVDDLYNISDIPIDPNKSSSIFKLKVYTQGGVLQKTLNIKGTDKLKTVLRRINGYKYNINDRIELWSSTPKNIRVNGNLVEVGGSDLQTNVTYVPNENNNSENSGEYKEDYRNGIDNPDYMKNVRFEIDSSALKYIYNKAPIFNGLSDLEVNRKGEIDYLGGVSVSDDYDEGLIDKVTYLEVDTSTIGEKYIEYKVVDSWGRVTLKKRKVTVYPYNNLEYNYITIKNNKQTDNLILSIRFDEDNKKFKVNKVDVSKIPSDLNDNEVLLEITNYKKKSRGVFNSSNIVETISITKDDLINNNLDKINNFSYDYGDFLSLKSYDYANGIVISAKSDPLLNGYESADKMENSRFEVHPEGLQMLYNAAPEIHGLENKKYIYRGEPLTKEKALEGISVDDDIDKGLKATNIVIKNQGRTTIEGVDTNELGDIELTYELTDSWGRTTSGKRVISVISKSASNDIEFYDTNGNNKLFSIKYNPIKNGFDFTKNTPEVPEKPVIPEEPKEPETSEGTPPAEEELIEPTSEEDQLENEDSESQGQEGGNQTEGQTQPESGDDNSTEEGGNEQTEDEITPENGDADSQEQGESQQPEEKKVFKLGVFNTQGEEVAKFELSEEEILHSSSFDKLNDISVYDDYYFSVWSNTPSRIKIKGDMTGNNRLGESGNENKDYSNGIYEADYMDNVRFKLRTSGLEAVYNKAPEIIIKTKSILTAFAGDPIDYLNGVIVLDDHDGNISTEKVKVDKVENNEEATLRIGKNKVNLSVEDSWGRKSTISRDIIISNGIDKNTIKVIGNSQNNEVLQIGFDHITNRLIVTTYDRHFQGGSAGNGYFKILIERPNSTTNPVEEISFNAKEQPTQEKLNGLTSYQFQYGDLIKIYHGHPNRLIIDGKVIDSREDYTDGVQNPENLLNTKFEITTSGLKAVYENPDKNKITGNKNIIGPMAPEKFPFKLQVDPSTKKIKAIDRERNMILATNADKSEVVYKVVLIGSNGIIKKESRFTAGEWGISSTEVESWYRDGGVSYEDDDALYIWHKEPHRSIIKGNIINQREDYSNGVDDPDNMNHVVFKLTPNGLESVYNNAPEIKGVEDKDVYKGQVFNPSEGVTYTDDHDPNDLTTSITSSYGSNNGEIDTNVLGEYIVTYTATDRWNKTTTVNRKITVRPNLYKNVFKVFSDNTQTQVLDNDTRKPAFEIGFDSVTNKYRVFNQKGDRLSEENPEDTAFWIEIKGSDGNKKIRLDLLGNDRGNSPKLNKINEINYDYGDIIRVYRSNLSAISIVGDVTGDIPKPPLSNDTDKFDYMLNTGFKVSEAGLEAIYNNAPVFNGIFESKTVTKGSNINLLDGVDVSDDIDKNISNADISITINDQLIEVDKRNNYSFDKLGIYKVKYMLSDSWNRTILKESTITVESKVKENSIEVYGPNKNLAFKITFDTIQNKFVLTDTNTPDLYNSSSEENKYFEMVVRNIKGKERYRVTLNGEIAHDTEELKKIHEKNFEKYDTIALYGKTADTVKIKGHVVSSNSSRTNHDYSNGFGDTNKYSEVRFKITDDGLKEMTKKDPIVTVTDNKTIKRGDNIELLDGVLVNTQDQNNEDYEINVDKDSFNYLKEGNYTVTYTVTNSWGSSVVKTRNITVEPRTELEEVKLKLKDTYNRNILTIGFDSIERKLRVLDHTLNESIDLNNSKLAFAINAYDSIGNTLATIELKGTDIISQELVDRINNFGYVEGYRLSIWANNPSQHISIDGIIKNRRENYANGIDNIDKMENGRFEILSDGLKYIYNKAPEISGGEKIIQYYKGNILNVPEDISVSDDHDTTITRNQVVIDDDQVDYDELGEYPIKYIVEDSWGRTAEKAGKINIKSAMDSNIISIYPKTDVRTQNTTSNPSAFDIKFVRDEATKTNKIQIENKSNAKFNPNKPNDIFMTIKIYGADGQEKKSVNLLGSHTATNDTTVNDNGVGDATYIKATDVNGTEDGSATNDATLNSLHNYVYNRGDYIAIEGVTEDIKDLIKIKGTIVNKREEYTNGVKNLDNIQNVRFKFTDLGLESVYNEAPTITIDESVSIDGIKGDNIPYMRGVKLRDDHDKLTKDNVEVTWNKDSQTTSPINEEQYNDVIKGVAHVGENTLHYKVTDTWGRTIEETRKVNLTNGMLSNEISFRQGRNVNNEILKITFDKLNNNTELNNRVKLKLLVRNDLQFFPEYPGDGKYYGIKIYYPENEQSNNQLLRDIVLNAKDTGVDRKLDVLDDLELPYGTKFEFYAGHPDNLRINGPVRNQFEDYSDGAQNPENYTQVKFEVTDSGLKSIYTEPDEIREKENIIAIVARESLPVRFKVDPVSKKINVFKTTTTQLQYEIGENIKVFEMTLTSANGTEEKAKIEAHSNTRGDNGVFNRFNDRSFEYGDYLTIWHKTPKRIVIKGNVQDQREDYFDGVDNSRNLYEAVFKLTPNGLQAVYKGAPKIRGAKDIKIEKGTIKNKEDLDKLLEYLSGEVKAYDDIDGEITEDIQRDHSKLMTDKVGLYEVTYEVTNTNERTAKRSSTVIVYAKPVIEENSKRIIELNGVENTEEAIEKYLKTAVDVTDEEDDANNKTVKLEVLSNDVNPNEEGIYSATYKATDSDGYSTEKKVEIQVTRTINVSVPTVIPFQVVTNLIDKGADPFVSGVLKLQNNNTSPVQVSLKSFTKKSNSGDLELVNPTTVENWDNLSSDETMRKMSLGIFHKEGLVNVENKIVSEDEPLWLTDNMNTEQLLGTLQRARTLSNPSEAQLSFTSKHGKNFKGGTATGKFDLVFKFE